MVVSGVFGSFQRRSFRNQMGKNAFITPRRFNDKVARRTKKHKKASREDLFRATLVENIVGSDRESSEGAMEHDSAPEVGDRHCQRVAIDAPVEADAEGISTTGLHQNSCEREDAQQNDLNSAETSQVIATKRNIFEDCYRLSHLRFRKSDHSMFESFRRRDEEKVFAASYHFSQDEGIPRGAVRDIAFRKGAEHPNVLQFLDAFLEPSKAIVVSSCAGDTLNDFISACYNPSQWNEVSTKRCTMDEPLIRSLCLQLLQGVEFCHSRRVILSNLKTPNVFIDASVFPPLLRIGGFGSATLAADEERFGIAMTATFLSPELLLGSKVEGLEADMWSVGCILGEMATGSPLFFFDNTEIGTLMKIFQQLGTPTESSWPGVSKLPDFQPNFPKWKPRPWKLQDEIGVLGVALLELLLSLDPKARISARRALKHSWFDGITVRGYHSLDGAVAPSQYCHVESRSVIANDFSKFRYMYGSCTAACSKRPFLAVLDALVLVDAFVGQSPVSQYVEYLRDIDSFAFQTEAIIPMPSEDFWHADGEEGFRGKFSFNFEEGLRCRATLVEWMIGICNHRGMRESTLFLAVAYVDSYMHRKQITPGKLQCLGCTAMVIASKFEDDAQLEASWLVRSTGGAVTQSDLESMEFDVTNALNFNFNLPVVPYFLHRFLHINGCDEAHRCLVHYLGVLTLANIRDFQYPPSQIAAAAVLLSNRLLKRTEAWPQVMKVRTGYTEYAESSRPSLDQCVTKLRAHVRSMRNNVTHRLTFQAYVNKFDQSVFDDL